MIRVLTIAVALLLMSGGAGATVLSPGMLPYTTVANNETITFSADSLGSLTSGITVAHSGVTIDGTRPGGKNVKLQLGLTAGGSGNTGIRMDIGASDVNLTVKRLKICMNDQTASSNSAISFGRGWKVTVQDCSLYVSGTDAHAILLAQGGTSMANQLFQRIQIWDSSITYTSRHSFTGSCIWIQQNPSAILGSNGNIYHTRFEKVVINLCPSQGIIMRGACYVYQCTVRVATENTVVGQKGNAYAIMYRNVSNSSDPANYPSGIEYSWAGADTVTNYRTNRGGRGMHIHGVCAGSVTYPVRVRYNTFLGSVGPLDPGDFTTAHAIRLEGEANQELGHDIDISYNTLISGGDDNPASGFRTNQPMALFANFCDADYNIAIHHNTIVAYGFGVIANGIDDEAFAVRLDFLSGAGASRPATGYDSTITFTDNTVRIGVPFSSSYCALFENNTITKLPIDSCATNSSDAPSVAILGLRSSDGSRADSGTHYLSNTYSGISATSVIEENASYTTECNAYVGLRHHTIVRDASSNPVPSASVYYIKSPYTNASDTVYRGTTSASGEVIGIVDFYREKQVGSTITETDFNPFKIIAIKGADKDSLSGTTLASTTTTTYLTFGAGAGTTPSLPITGGTTVSGGVIIK